MITFNPCFVIPNYNHTAVFATMIEQLLSFEMAIIVVDDGSEQSTAELLDNIAQEHDLVNVIHLSVNSGKGGAVMVGLKKALEQGFTHAIQIDADGQHNLADIPEFLSESRSQPTAIICGYPVYDESVPMGRLIPRYITHFWVWVETLCFAIKDSMCGFRVYPLEQTVAVINQYKVGTRMDFDIEILVRLHWSKVKSVFLPTKVIYPENGLSHFQLMRDNWLISKMHTRLFFGMLIRIPLLININMQRKNETQSIEHWGKTEERGSLKGIKLLVWSYKIFGRKFFLLLLHPIIGYFALMPSKSKRASRQFFSRLADFQGKPYRMSWGQTYRHFYEFGVSAIDKIGAWMGDIQRKDVVVDDNNIFSKILASGKGAVFIGSHLGNLELCRALGEKGRYLKINALVFNKNALKFQHVLSQSDPEVEINLIHVENIGLETAILLSQKVEQGEIVIIVGDRTSVKSVGRVHRVDFLGAKASLAEGPFILAGVLECPVYLLFCLRQKGRYHVYLEHFADSLKFPRKQRKELLEQNLQDYAHRLAFYCQKAPYQWFNFFDFWQADDSKKHKR